MKTRIPEAGRPQRRPIITLQEWVERRCGAVSKSAANNWVREGRLQAYRSGEIWLVRASLRMPRTRPTPTPTPLRPDYVTVKEWSAQHGCDLLPENESR